MRKIQENIEALFSGGLLEGDRESIENLKQVFEILSPSRGISPALFEAFFRCLFGCGRRDFHILVTDKNCRVSRFHDPEAPSFEFSLHRWEPSEEKAVMFFTAWHNGLEEAMPLLLQWQEWYGSLGMPGSGASHRFERNLKNTLNDSDRRNGVAS